MRGCLCPAGGRGAVCSQPAGQTGSKPVPVLVPVLAPENMATLPLSQQRQALACTRRAPGGPSSAGATLKAPVLQPWGMCHSGTLCHPIPWARDPSVVTSLWGLQCARCALWLPSQPQPAPGLAIFASLPEDFPQHPLRMWGCQADGGCSWHGPAPQPPPGPRAMYPAAPGASAGSRVLPSICLCCLTCHALSITELPSSMRLWAREEGSGWLRTAQEGSGQLLAAWLGWPLPRLLSGVLGSVPRR